MRRSIFAVSITLALSIGCGPAVEQPPVPLFDNLGHFHREISTRSDQTQRFFDQGLTLYFGFNHEEAIRAFEQASLLDPECAMAPWGKALALGPNINNPAMDEAASLAAFEAIQRAVELTGNAAPVERDLIEALAVRYASPPPEDRSALDAAYADAMRDVWRAHPRDADVGALFVESMMDLRPWDLWTADGQAQPGTDEITAALETVLALAPDHPGANHFYIHTVEASPEPGRGTASADRLRGLVPGAGHLVHMPSHIDIRTGDYQAAVLANQRAIAADLAYVERVGRHGFYTLYRAHNYHFLAYAAMFEARREVALEAAREMILEVPLELVREMPDFLDGFLVAPIHVMVRFGLWQELLEQGRVVEAEAVYREDLRINPNNGWALLGLAECLHRTGRHEEAEATDSLVRTAWARADINPRVSCFCRTEI